MLRLFHAKMQEQNVAFGTARPRFRIVVLFVDEATSIARQLARGRSAQAHNKEVEATGVGKLWPVRETDINMRAALRRYQMYLENTLAPLETLKDLLTFNTVDATGTVPEVEKVIQHEMKYVVALQVSPCLKQRHVHFTHCWTCGRYQSSLELGLDTFKTVCTCHVLRLRFRTRLLACACCADSEVTYRGGLDCIREAAPCAAAGRVPEQRPTHV